MKIIFMGTPDFSLTVLKDLFESRHEIVLAVTGADKTAGRGNKLVESPVKRFALEKEIPVFQPRSLKKEATKAFLRDVEADLIVVVAYGNILPKEVLEMKRFGAVNVHASLLPAYRGAAPIQWAVINGEKESGVTIMQMDEGLDTGDILKQKTVLLDEKETGDSLFKRLAEISGPLLLETLSEIEAGTLRPVPQGETTTAYAKMLDKAFGLIDFKQSAESIERLIRGLHSWPGAYAHLNGKMIKFISSEAVSDEENGLIPGTVHALSKHGFLIKCGKGSLRLVELQPEGKRRMSTDEYLRGNALKDGMRFIGKEDE